MEITTIINDIKSFLYTYEVRLSKDFVHQMIDMIDVIDVISFEQKIKVVLDAIKTHIYTIGQSIPEDILKLKKLDLDIYRRASFLYRIQIRQMRYIFYDKFINMLRNPEYEENIGYYTQKKINRMIKTYQKNELKRNQQKQELIGLSLLHLTCLPTCIIDYHIKPFFTCSKTF